MMMSGINNATDTYFKSYEDLDVHQLMLDDKPRTLAYKNAIFSIKDKLSDKVVMDVGAGTGILSVFCAQAGAKKIYAIEASDLASLTIKVAEENNVKDKIEVVHKKVEDLNTDDIEHVDIIVSEWMGFYLLHEGMLDSVILARDKFLKPNGLMFPSAAKIYAAPCQLPNYFEFWDDIQGVSMKCVAENYRQSKFLAPEISTISEDDLLVEGKVLIWLDLTSVTSKELDNLGGEETISVCSKDGKYQGMAIWFDVEFPDGSTLSTAPSAEPTHWKQTIIVLPYSIDVSDKEPIAYQVKLDRNETNPRRYDIAFTMLDESEILHEVPCDCYKTKCIVVKTFVQNLDSKIDQ